MLIPLAMGLIGPEGGELPTRLEDEAASRIGTRVLPLAEARQSFRFVDVPAPPVPSLLRGFSAPVKLKDVPLERVKFLAVHDTEPFARWEAGQQVATKILLDRIGAHQRSEAPAPLDSDLIAAMRRILVDAGRDPAFAAEALTLPSEAFLADQLPSSMSRLFTPPAKAPARRSAKPWRRNLLRVTGISPMRAPTASMAPRSAGERCATRASPISPPPIPKRVQRSPWRSSRPGEI